MARYEYDMKMYKKKEAKMAGRDDLDYNELTVSEDEWNDEESKRFKTFIKERREEIKERTELHGREAYSDDYFENKEDAEEFEKEQVKDIQKKMDETMDPAEKYK